jgi:outer membrane protein assembly factor BamD
VKKLSVFLVFLMLFGFAAEAQAYWVWSPDLGKWVNPKKNAKDTPEEQYDWAMQFYNNKDYDRAVEEFEKLPAAFPASKLAAEGVYYTGICWEEKKDIAKAADNYQKLIDSYPYSDRIKDAIKREFEIANQFAAGAKVKVVGMPVLPGSDKALELYKHIVKNAPFGTYGDQAQFQIGELYKSTGEYQEAQKAYQQVMDDYPSSPLVPKAKYQIAYVSMLASNHSVYNEQQADRAVEEFQGLKNDFPENQEALEADESIRVIRNEKAQAILKTAQFYDKQRRYKSAKIYYREITERYGDTAVAEKAKNRLTQILNAEDGSGQGTVGKVADGVGGNLGRISATAGNAVGGVKNAISGMGQSIGGIFHINRKDNS